MSRSPTDDGVTEGAVLVVRTDEHFPRDETIFEGHDARAGFRATLAHEARHEPLAQGIKIAKAIPDLCGVDLDAHFFVNACHADRSSRAHSGLSSASGEEAAELRLENLAIAAGKLAKP